MRVADVSDVQQTVTAPQMDFAGCVRAAFAILVKDALCELRAKHSAAAVLLFAITSTVAVSFVLNAWGKDSSVSAALLWIVLYFSAMTGLGRSFVREEEMETAAVLKLAVRPSSVYLGKLTFNLGLLAVLAIVTVPLFLLLMSARVHNWGLFVASIVTGCAALSAGATATAAMVAKAANKGALYAVISFPLLIPVLALAIRATDAAMGGAAAGGAANVRLLIYYCGVVIPASLMLFGHIWEE